MALKIIRPLAKPVVKPAAPQSLTQTGPRETGDTKSTSLRLPASHWSMLEEAKAIAECDKSEALKRGLRLLHTALTSHDAVLHVTDAAGNKHSIPIMRNGRVA